MDDDPSEGRHKDRPATRSRLDDQGEDGVDWAFTVGCSYQDEG
jgi:hypothetical protein